MRAGDGVGGGRRAGHQGEGEDLGLRELGLLLLRERRGAGEAVLRAPRLRLHPALAGQGGRVLHLRRHRADDRGGPRL